MAVQQLTSTEVSEAQRVYITQVYNAYQNNTDMWSWVSSLPADKVNKKGLQVPVEVRPNASLGYVTGDGDALPTAQAPSFDAFTVSYVGMQAGSNETYAAVLNNNKETSEDILRRVTESDARQFASYLNSYVSFGNGTQALATTSDVETGATVPVNGTSDSIGNSALVIDGYYEIWDAAGTTQRTTTNAGPHQLVSKTTANATFDNLPTDVIATDIIVPAGTTTDASYGLYGLPVLIESTGAYFDISNRTTIGGLVSYEKTSAGTVTAGMLAETYASIQQRGGYFGKDKLIDMLHLVMNTGNWNMYLGLTYSSGAIVGGVHQLNHRGSERPAIDVGGAMVNFTWFGAPIKIGSMIRGDEIYYICPNEIRRAVLKNVGDVTNLPAGDWLQGVDSNGNYTNNRLKWRDFFGQVYAPQPYKMGKISGITLSSPTQKATSILTA